MIVRRKKVAAIAMMAAFVVLVMALSATTAAGAQQNPDCLLCHEAVQQFAAVGVVDRDSTCRSCHTPGLQGTHPNHNAGSNCGAFCHNGWGESLQFAIPTYLGSAGSFASPTSQDTPSEVLHVIHNNPRWQAGGIDTPLSACTSCHGVVSCDACHTSGVSATHETHSSTTNTQWSGTVSYGIIGEDQTIKSATAVSNYCGSSDCHDIAGLQSGAPLIKEDFSPPKF